MENRQNIFSNTKKVSKRIEILERQYVLEKQCTRIEFQSTPKGVLLTLNSTILLQTCLSFTICLTV